MVAFALADGIEHCANVDADGAYAQAVGLGGIICARFCVFYFYDDDKSESASIAASPSAGSEGLLGLAMHTSWVRRSTGNAQGLCAGGCHLQWAAQAHSTVWSFLAQLGWRQDWSLWTQMPACRHEHPASAPASGLRVLVAGFFRSRPLWPGLANAEDVDISAGS